MPTCESVSFCTKVSFLTFILRFDRASLRSLMLHPINLATVDKPENKKETALKLALLVHPQILSSKIWNSQNPYPTEWNKSYRPLLSSDSGSAWFSLSIMENETFPSHNTAASIANTLSWSSLLTCTISKASCNSKEFFNQKDK